MEKTIFQYLSSSCKPPGSINFPNVCCVSSDESCIFQSVSSQFSTYLHQESTVYYSPCATPTTSFHPSGRTKKIIDLPSFSGDPKDWLSFKDAFEESYSAMKYLNWENDIRLTKTKTSVWR